MAYQPPWSCATPADEKAGHGISRKNTDITGNDGNSGSFPCVSEFFRGWFFTLTIRSLSDEQRFGHRVLDGQRNFQAQAGPGLYGNP